MNTCIFKIKNLLLAFLNFIPYSFLVKGLTLLTIASHKKYLASQAVYQDSSNLPAITPEKFAKLNIAKYQRDLTLQEKADYLRYLFFERLGYELDLYKPKTFNEKMQWLKLFYENDVCTICADKYRVREYVAEKIGDEYLIPMLGVWDDPNDIDFEKLPDAFVLKVNWGSGQNIIVENKEKVDFDFIKKRLQEWINFTSNHYYEYLEPHYKNIPPKILCEELIDDLEKVIDYKFYIFSGSAYCIDVNVDRYIFHTSCFYDRNWNNLNFTTLTPLCEKQISKPINFEKMLELAECLAKDFPFARVDFYNNNGKIFFGEITYFPSSGLDKFEPAAWDMKLGDMLTLPKANSTGLCA